jgi:predicted ATPase
MEVSVKNFGTISSADVHIGGLTVITGENDTGKSTIGKILFSLVKAVARYEEDLEEVKEDRFTEEAQNLYYNLRRHVNFAENSEIRDLFHPRKFYSQMKIDQSRAYEERIDELARLGAESNIPDRSMDVFVQSLNKIVEIMNEPDDALSVMNRAVRKSFFSEFKDEIISRGSKASLTASISVTDGASNLIDITWEKEGVHKFSYVDDLGYSDATYVESPAIIQFHQIAMMAKTLLENDSSRLTVPLHIKDLANKLSDSKFGISGIQEILPESDGMPNISSEVDKLLGGVISYDDDRSDFLLERNGYTISSSNIASGIKALGILDMLVRGGNVTKNTLLVLDEPEVNLHPKWQVDYCKIVCSLVKAGVDVIITTHSPYIVEALKHFSDESSIEHNFYLAKKTADCESTFIDITRDISIAIDTLAAPLNKLNNDSLEDFLS